MTVPLILYVASILCACVSLLWPARLYGVLAVAVLCTDVAILLGMRP